MKTWILAVALLYSLETDLLAKQFDAIVTEINNGGESITATVTDEYGITEKDVRYQMLPNATVIGYPSFKNLQVGNRIKMQADKDTLGVWQVSRLEPFQQ